jgi:hypothetical protein
MSRLAHVNNRDPRYDASGAIVDAHDGGLEYFAGRFYWYGTAYGATDGFSAANAFRVYSSPDLTRWTPHGDILPDRPAGVYYRPHVAYCAATARYVLWYNWYPTLWEGQYGVAVSETPQGPFRIVGERVAVRHAQPGDHGLFVDDDGAAYLIYTSIAEGHAISVERLTPDYCASAGESSGLLSRGDEACALFKRGATYYALFDSCCCFCPWGSGAKVFTAASPLGPYTFRGNINRQPSPCGDVPIINAQQAHVARLPSTGGPLYTWTADRWGSRLDGVKGHDFQFWSAPLEFADDGSIAPLRWVNEWSFELAA